VNTAIAPLEAGAPGHLMVDGVRLEAVWHGPPPGEATTLVFLHEGLGCVSMWQDVPERLARATGCGALVYSRRGYGHSDPCPLPRRVDYLHRETLEVLPRVLAEAGVEDCILIGHSDGGSMAILYLGEIGGEVARGAITLAAHVFVEDLTVQSIAAARERYLTGELRERLAKHHGAATDHAFWGWNHIWLDPEFRRWNIESSLPRIRAPMLVIQAEDDPYGTPAQVEAIARGSGGPVETLMVPEGGHRPHLRGEAWTLPPMQAFIERMLGRDRPG
jgi:pimeloyl-ACP methyl ester carboxylesterase